MTKNVSVPEGYKKTELGVIPKDWNVIKVNDFCDVKTGGTPSTKNKDFWDGDIPWMSSGEINKTFVCDTEKKITQKGLENSNARILPADSVMMALNGQGKTRGSVAVLKIPSTCNQSLACMIPNKKITHYLYLFYNLQRRYSEIRNYTGDTGREGLNLKIIKDIKVPLPSFPEQQKIASILSKVDEQIEQTEQIIEKTELLKKGLMQKLLTKGIGHAEFKTFLFKGQKINMPKSWSISTINSHLVEHKGGAPLKPTDFTEKGIRVLPKKAIAKGGILRIKESEQSYASEEFSKKHKTSIVDKSYLITTLRDLVPSGPNIGLIVKINDENEYLMAQGVYGFKLRDTLDVDFLVQYSNSLTYRKIMNKIMVGSTQVHIRNGDFFNVKIPLPPLDEQQKIASILSKVDSQIQDNQNYLTKLQELKKGLMQDLLTGKVRVCV